MGLRCRMTTRHGILASRLSAGRSLNGRGRETREPSLGSDRVGRVPLRAAAIFGLLAPVTFIVGLVLGDLAQSDEFSPANDNISDIGAQTADQAWLYNQIAANLTGLLIVAFALGLSGAYSDPAGSRVLASSGWRSWG
jgi:Protein of unknown function (DUF998)